MVLPIVACLTSVLFAAPGVQAGSGKPSTLWHPLVFMTVGVPAVVPAG